MRTLLTWRLLCFLAICLHLSACDRIKKMTSPTTDAGTDNDSTDQCYPPEMSCDAGPVDFVRQICYFPLQPVMDGELTDTAWDEAIWQEVDHEKSRPGIAGPDSDEDAWFRFACVSDGDYLYFGFEVRDDVAWYGGNDEYQSSNTHEVDSLEIYLDQCREKHSTNVDNKYHYNGDDIQLTIEAQNAVSNAVSYDPLMIGPFPASPEFKGILVEEIIGALQLNAKTTGEKSGWQGELKIPLSLTGNSGGSMQIALKTGRIVGFQIGYNDNDSVVTDNGREHKLIWGEADRDSDSPDLSFRDPSRFGDLLFCKIR